MKHFLFSLLQLKRSIFFNSRLFRKFLVGILTEGRRNLKYLRALILGISVQVEIKFLSWISSKTKINGSNIIIVYDPFIEGHHAFYTLQLADKLADNSKVFVLSPSIDVMTRRAKEARIDAERLNFIDVSLFTKGYEISDDFNFHPKLEKFAALEFWRRVLKVRQKVAPKNPAFLFFPYMDLFLPQEVHSNFIDEFQETRWGGVLFHPGWTRRPNQFPPKLLESKNLHFIALLDKYSETRIRNSTVEDPYFFLKTKNVEIATIPDFADLTRGTVAAHFHHSKEILARAKGRRIISLLGSIEKRKGLLKFLQLPNRNEKMFFVCAGKLNRPEFSDDELNYLDMMARDCPENLYISWDNFIEPEAALNEIISISDVLFLVYENFLHSSNFITKGAAFNVPVLVQSGGYMAEVTQEFGLGLVSENDNIDELNGKLLTLSQSKSKLREKHQIFAELSNKKNIDLDKLIHGFSNPQHD